MENVNERLFDFIAACPTPFQAVEHSASLLEKAGFRHLSEAEDWHIEAGGKYYVTRNGSSLIALRVPRKDYTGCMMTAAHCDSPCFRIKENAEKSGGGYVQLNVEKYGGMLCSTWMDRPLAVAGRLALRTEGGVETRLVDSVRPVALIPNVAIHMNRSANDSMSYNMAVDMLPLYGSEKAKGSFLANAASWAGAAPEDILAFDLFVYNPERGREWGEYISSPRLDDLQSAFCCLNALIAAEDSESLGVFCLFDNEEVGSRTKQGAESTFLSDVLRRVAAACGKDGEGYRKTVANSFLVSCDNAHAVHPNHPEYSDADNSVRMNGGVVIKFSANQRYTTDAVSAAIFRRVCDEAGVPCQTFFNRSDMAGGSTLGNISNTQVSLNTVDVGIAQLAMHSAFETAGAEDTEMLLRALTAFYSKSLAVGPDGIYKLK